MHVNTLQQASQVQRLMQERQRQHLSLIDMADSTGFSHDTLQIFEQGPDIWRNTATKWPYWVGVAAAYREVLTAQHPDRGWTGVMRVPLVSASRRPENIHLYLSLLGVGVWCLMRVGTPYLMVVIRGMF